MPTVRSIWWLVRAGLLVAWLPVGCFEAGSPPAAPEAGAEAEGAAAGAPPRVLLITVDTLRVDHVGAYGSPVATPSMDRLAAEGVLVESAYTPTPTTGPAHASLLTGLYPWRHGVLDNAVPLAPEPPTVAALARDAGFETAAFVSSYILDARFGLDRGFERYDFTPSEPYRWRGEQRPAFWTRGGPTTDAALAWLAEHRDRPLFAWVHYFDPHSPYDPPRGYRRVSEEPAPVDGKTLPPGIPSYAALQAILRAYRGEVGYADDQIGRLLRGLDELGLAGSTAVVLTADHGEGLGDHGLLEHGHLVFDELVRVPLVVRAPGLPRGERRAGLAQLEDLAPTLLALLGLPAPPALDGVDLLPWLRGDRADSPRDAVLGRRKRYEGRPELYFQRRGDEKWIGEPGAGGQRFRLDLDPGERRGAPDPSTPGPLAEALAAGTAAGPPRVLDETTREALEALGYLED